MVYRLPPKNADAYLWSASTGRRFKSLCHDGEEGEAKVLKLPVLS